METLIYAQDKRNAEALASVVSRLNESKADGGLEECYRIGKVPSYNPFKREAVNMAESSVSLKVTNTESSSGAMAQEEHRTRPLRVWVPPPDTKVKATVVLLHGYGEHSGRYLDVGSFFAEKGMRVVAIDHNYHGSNTNNKGYKIKGVENFDEFYTTSFAFMKLIADKYPEEPLFLLGHSMGGLISFKTLLLMQEDNEVNPDSPLAKVFKGAVLSAPCLYMFGTPLLNPYRTWLKTLIGWIAAVFPTFKLPGATLSALTRTAEVKVATKADKSCFGDATSASFIGTFVRATEVAQKQFAQLRVPFLVAQGDKDKVVNKKGAQELFDQCATSEKDKQLLKIPKGFHEILNDPERVETLNTMLAWMETRM